VHVIYGTSIGLTSKGDHFRTAEGAHFVHAKLGVALAAGDINGDGLSDLAIGGPGVLDKMGVVAIAYGSTSGLGELFINWQTVDLAEGGDGLGSTVAVADFNGDGFADVAAGASGEEVLGVVGAGAVIVFYGRPGVVLTGEQFWHQNSYGVEDKIEPLDHFGASLSAGDYNADGLADLAIGVYSEDIGSIPNVGAVNVITGSTIGLHSGADCLLLPAIRTRNGFFGQVLAH
jgi:hypothetical protein